MTFVEAAIQILRAEGKPLNVKDLTRLAIKNNLLSVVGRDPESMMDTRLAIETKRPSADLVRLGNGLYGLRKASVRSEQTGVQKTEGEKVQKPKGETSSKSTSDPPKRRRAGSQGGGENLAKPPKPQDNRGKAAGAEATHKSQAKKKTISSRKGPSSSDSLAAAPKQTSPNAETQVAPSGVSALMPPLEMKPPEPQGMAISGAKPGGVVAAPGDKRDAEAVCKPVSAAVESLVPVFVPGTAAGSEREPVVNKSEPVVNKSEPAAASKTAALPDAAPKEVAQTATKTDTQPEQRSAGHPGPHPHRSAHPREERHGSSSATPNPSTSQPRQWTLADAAHDVLRGISDGRALSHRQIAEIALKRRLLRGDVADLSRAMRAALVREQRHRDSEGLRPRVRTVGPGLYTLGERKLETEIFNAERDLVERASRLREATRVALRRRLRQLQPGAFELLMRLLLERLGQVGAELVKRGEGVAYYGGTMSRGGRTMRVLVSIRPGEAELPREAIGELRAGVRLRNFDEGLLLCAAKASAAAQTEAGAAPGIEFYDQDSLAELLIRHHLGVRRMHLPLDYLDTELFTELLDQG